MPIVDLYTDVAGLWMPAMVGQIPCIDNKVHVLLKSKWILSTRQVQGFRNASAIFTSFLKGFINYRTYALIAFILFLTLQSFHLTGLSGSKVPA